MANQPDNIAAKRKIHNNYRKLPILPDSKTSLYKDMLRQLLHDGYVDVAESLVQSTGVFISNIQSMNANKPNQPLTPENNLENLVELGRLSQTINNKNAVNESLHHTVDYLLDQSIYVEDATLPLTQVRLTEQYTTALLGPLRSSCWTSDGQYIACGTALGDIKLFSLSALNQANSAWLASLAQNPNSTGNSVSFETSMSLARDYKDHSLSVEWMQFHPLRPTILCSASKDGTIILRDLYNPDIEALPANYRGKPFADAYSIRCCDFHPSGEYLLYGTEHSVPRLYHLETAQVYAPEARHTAAVTAVAFAGDGRVFATGGCDGRLGLYDTAAGRATWAAPAAHAGAPVSSAAFSRSGQALLTAGMDGQCRLWDRRRLSCEAAAFRQPRGTDGLVRAQFDCAERRIFAQNASLLSIDVIDIFSGKMVSSLQHDSTLQTFAMNPQQLSVATGGVDGRLRIWSAF